jgi:hypothetical protein
MAIQDFKDLSVKLGKHLDIVMLAVLIVQLKNQKEVGVHLKDLTLLQPNLLLINNLSVFLLEGGQIPLILLIQLNKLPH